MTESNPYSFNAILTGTDLTSLMYFVRKNDVGNVLGLLSAGANPDAQNRLGQTII